MIQSTPSATTPSPGPTRGTPRAGGLWRVNLIALAVILVLGLIAVSIGPWWWLAVVAFGVGFVVRPRRAGSLFFSGLLAGALVYAVGALIFSLGDATLPARIAELFGLGSAVVLGFVIALVGGVSAGVAALLGGYTRAVVQGRPV